MPQYIQAKKTPHAAGELAFVAQGKGQPNKSQKIQICAELGFWGPNSEYAYVNFLGAYFDFSAPRFD